MKTPEVIESRIPAITALIQIGPAASRALLRMPAQCMTLEDRLAVIFTISKIPGVPEAHDFLLVALGQANAERYWAEERLKQVAEHH